MDTRLPSIENNTRKFYFTRLDENCLQEIGKFLTTCDDFSMLVSGQPHQPAEALGLLHDLPPGKTTDDKLALGIRTEKGELIGVLDLVDGYPQDSVCFIGLLLLRPDYRGNGLGCQIMRCVAHWAARQGFKALMLGVVEENQVGIRFWESCGFESVETSSPRAFGLKTQRVLRMRKELHGQL